MSSVAEWMLNMVSVDCYAVECRLLIYYIVIKQYEDYMSGAKDAIMVVI